MIVSMADYIRAEKAYLSAKKKSDESKKQYDNDLKATGEAYLEFQRVDEAYVASHNIQSNPKGV